MLESAFPKILLRTLSVPFLVILNSSATAGQAAENWDEKNILGHSQAEVGDFGTSEIGAVEINKRIRDLEIDEVLARIRQTFDRERVHQKI